MMKVVILAGGLGTRLSEETVIKPKPLVEIGSFPIIWHIMKIYSYHGFNEFIICCGYKGYMIKEYFSNYHLHTCDVNYDFTSSKTTFSSSKTEGWKISLIDTGDHTMTGGRLKRIRPLLGKNEDFCMTYGDGLSDIDINGLVEYHKSHKRLATVTAVTPPGRFGILSIASDNQVIGFSEKKTSDEYKINGGFFVLNSKVLDDIDGDETVWEKKPLERLSSDNNLMAYKHDGFWQPMDTLREKFLLEDLWNKNKAPWKLWQ